MAAGEKPDFSHLGLTEGKSSTRWRTYITPAAEQLEKTLWASASQVLSKSWGTCLVCDQVYPANLQSHVWGGAHWMKLKDRLNWAEPTSQEHLDSFTQYFPLNTPGKAYSFNHVTGQQRFCDYPGAGAPGPSPAPAPAGPPAPAAPVAPPPAAAAPMAPPAAAAPMAPPPGGAAAPGPPSPPSPAQGPPGGAAAPPEGGDLLLFAHGEGYAAALNGGKDGWRNFMGPPGKALEDSLFRFTRSWDHECQVCMKPMQRGAQDHVQSQNHWKLLWKDLEGMSPTQPTPPRDAAEDMTRPWVQSFPVPGGTFQFNHLTGGQRLVRSAAAPQAAPAAVPSPAAPPAASVAPPWTPSPTGQPTAFCPPCGSPSVAAALPARAVAAPSAAAFRDARIVDPRTPMRNNLSYKDAVETKTNWSLFMAGPAEELERTLWQLLPTYNGPCGVCGGNVNGVKEHTLSAKHYKAICHNVSSGVPDVEEAIRWDRPWVQKFDISNGEAYLFNHITGQQHRVQKREAGEAGCQNFNHAQEPAHVPPVPDPASAAGPPPGAASGGGAPPAAAAPPAANGFSPSYLSDGRNLSRGGAAGPPPASAGGGPPAPGPAANGFSPAPPGPGLAAAAPGAAPGAAPPGAAAPAAVPPGAAAPSAPGAACSEHELWHWRGIVAGPSSRLAGALAGAPPAQPVRCDVCEGLLDDVQAHLASEAHLVQLRLKLGTWGQARGFHFEPGVQDGMGVPWKQAIGGVVFNHWTLEVAEVASQPLDPWQCQ